MSLQLFTEHERRAMSFREWLDKNYYEGFDPSSLSDEEYYELEEMYQNDNENN